MGRSEPGQGSFPQHQTWPFPVRAQLKDRPTETSVPGDFTGPLEIVPSSTNGICEYRATTFNNAMRGRLLVQQWNGLTYSVETDDQGHSIVDFTTLFSQYGALDVLTGQCEGQRLRLNGRTELEA